jgi:hypothetical protein
MALGSGAVNMFRGFAGFVRKVLGADGLVLVLGID